MMVGVSTSSTVGCVCALVGVRAAIESRSVRQRGPSEFLIPVRLCREGLLYMGSAVTNCVVGSYQTVLLCDEWVDAATELLV
jgi:hypothetical protein